MFVSQLTPKPDGEIGFSYATLLQAPEASGCYVLTISDGNILYIGQALNVSERMKQHLDKGDKKENPLGVSPLGCIINYVIPVNSIVLKTVGLMNTKLKKGLCLSSIK